MEDRYANLPYSSSKEMEVESVFFLYNIVVSFFLTKVFFIDLNKAKKEWKNIKAADILTWTKHHFLIDLFLFSFIASILALRSFFLLVSGITISYPSSLGSSFDTISFFGDFLSFSFSRYNLKLLPVAFAIFFDY